MKELLFDILAILRRNEVLDAKALAQLVRKHNENISDVSKHCAKKKLYPFYLRFKENHPEEWQALHIDSALEEKLISCIRMKPRRSASGVATITVLTKPWQCKNNCLYCPNDIRMPKSYLTDEPACQRAERNYFDPYLQVASRMKALHEMGHPTDKIELIILGGTWCDYPQSYRVWYIAELFQALCDTTEQRKQRIDERKAWYKQLGISAQSDTLKRATEQLQARVSSHEISYNQAIRHLYQESSAWIRVSEGQQAPFSRVFDLHKRNESCAHRVVGLVIETRPDTITCDNLREIRRLGATKIQIGIQSLHEHTLALNGRKNEVQQATRAFELLRIFGFKIHAHLMANLYGASPDDDKRDYNLLVHDERFLPDEIKLYPCALVDGTGLVRHHQNGTWRPYTYEQLVDVLCSCMYDTPDYVRISRMIRDISAQDILVGNKLTNLRQMVEQHAQASGKPIHEIRYREIGTNDFNPNTLAMTETAYRSTHTQEFFLQWKDEHERIAGFLRLSLPDESYVKEHEDELPIRCGEAMIREVHVYGAVAHLHKRSQGAQHLGLGKKLIERACEIAKSAGYSHMNVISAIGTREYYRKQGFCDAGLYQQHALLPTQHTIEPDESIQTAL